MFLMKLLTIVVTDGGVATVGKRARASVADTRYVIRVSAEVSGFDSTKKKSNKN